MLFLTRLYERWINEEITPNEWKTAYIIPIHKVDPQNDPKNYQGIAVIRAIG